MKRVRVVDAYINTSGPRWMARLGGCEAPAVLGSFVLWWGIAGRRCNAAVGAHRPSLVVRRGRVQSLQLALARGFGRRIGEGSVFAQTQY